MKHRFLHKALAGVLVLCLCFCGCIGSAEEKHENAAWTLDFSTAATPYESIKSLCWVGDTLYMLGSEVIYQWHRGEEAPQALCRLDGISSYAYMETPPEDQAERKLWEQAVQYLLPDGNRLLAYQPYSGQIFTVQAEGLTALATLPADILTYEADGARTFRELKRMTVIGDNAYLLLGTDDPQDWQKTSLVRFDLTKGQSEVLLAAPLRDFCAYGTEQIMCLQYDEEQGLYQFRPFLPADKTLAEPVLSSAEDQAVSMAAWNDELLLCSAGQIMACDKAGNQTVKAYAPVPSYATVSMACAADGLCAVAYSSFVFVRDLTQPASATVLHLMGDVDASELIAFSRQNPDIAVVTLPQLYDEALQQAILSGGSEIDLFVVEAPGLFGQLKAKGYLAPLDADASLKAKAAAFYPCIQEAISLNGQLMGMPINMSTQSWTLNQTLWDRFDLGEVPQTYAELLALMATWQDAYAEENPDYALVDLPGSVAECAKLLMREYILQCGSEYPDFTGESFRTAMQALIANQAVIAASGENYGMPIIYSYYQGFGIGYNDSEQTRMLLMPALTAGDEQKLSGTLTLLTMSSSCTKQEAALRFVAFMSSHLSAETDYMLDPSLDTPLRRSNHEERLATLQEEKAQLEQQLSTADEASKSGIRDAIARKENQIALVSEDWLISSESIDNYRTVARQLVIPLDSPLLGQSNGLESLDSAIDAACGGELTDAVLDSLLQTLNRIARMVMQEGE